MTQQTRYICIHGHFYQPPRENPWLDSIEIQDSAAPFHDWNERINAECYGPNSLARLLTPKSTIRKIINNFQHISFNFGPTLLTWMERNDPQTYQRIQEADRISVQEREGHGNAIAQAYNHMIMPLASEHDRETQIIWGMEDFRHRFGRDPEGMWLPETAVHTPTLALMAEHGLKYTLLSPTQAKRFRDKEGQWIDTKKTGIDPSRPYHVDLPNGQSIALFFYDGPISHAIAFGGILNNGEFFMGRMREAFSEKRTWAQLVHIANDGESFGHHHRYGEMALAYAIEKIEERNIATITNYGQYLARHPPEAEVEIHEKSAWSCAHGVERWQADCGCNTGGKPEWNQRWRAPLREALDDLKEKADAAFETEAAQWLSDPWEARNHYVQVILGNTPDARRLFVSEHVKEGVNGDEALRRCLPWLELQRYAMYMYTSCGWFFDEISGIEPVQNLCYAARVLQLADELGHDWEEGFLTLLAKAPSNLPEFENGRDVYDKQVSPVIVSFDRVAAHYAILFTMAENDETPEINGYEVSILNTERLDDGSNTLGVGRIDILSHRTAEKRTAAFAALYFGGRDVTADVSFTLSPNEYRRLKSELTNSFLENSLRETLAVIDHAFPGQHYGLPSLFVEARRQALDRLIRSALRDMRGALKKCYDTYRPLMMLINKSQAPLPPAYLAMTQAVLDSDSLKALDDFLTDGDIQPLEQTLNEAKRWDAKINQVPLEKKIERHLLALFETIVEPPQADRIQSFMSTLQSIEGLGLHIPLHELQNRFHIRSGRLELHNLPKMDGHSTRDKIKTAWLALARHLHFDPDMVEKEIR